MDRSKRAIKTPKRFDDEAYGPSPKQVFKPAVEATKTPAPETVTPKNIIKVKLTTKSRPRDSTSSISSSPTKEPLSSKSQQDVVKDISESSKETPKNKPSKLDETLKAEDAVKVKETPKQKESVKPKELAKVKAETTTKVAIKTPERDVPLVYRPKSKRPRTPPSYADLMPNLTLPFWDATTAADPHEKDDPKELVHCQCGIGEELGLMVQCETCLTWQHGHCLGLEKAEEVPDGYACRACSDPKFARESMKWAYDQEWLTKGRMKQFSCDPNPLSEKKVSFLYSVNNLIGHAVQLQKLLHNLRAKSMLLEQAKDDDPKLKLFRVQWPTVNMHKDDTYFVPNLEATPNDCRENLKLHIEQTEEFIGTELTQIENQLESLEKDCIKESSSDLSLESLKNDLLTIKKYLSVTC